MVKEEDLGKENGNQWNWKNKNSNEDNKLKKKFLADCVYLVGTASQTSDYKIITEFLINHIKKNYKWGGNIAYALSNKKDYDLITMYLHKVL